MGTWEQFGKSVDQLIADAKKAIRSAERLAEVKHQGNWHTERCISFITRIGCRISTWGCQLWQNGGGNAFKILGQTVDEAWAGGREFSVRLTGILPERFPIWEAETGYDYQRTLGRCCHDGSLQSLA